MDSVISSCTLDAPKEAIIRLLIVPTLAIAFYSVSVDDFKGSRMELDQLMYL